jgi:hypothetical protein
MDDSAIIRKNIYIHIWHVSQPAGYVGHFGVAKYPVVLSCFYKKLIRILK